MISTEPKFSKKVMVGLGRVELPTNGLGKQKAIMTRFETFGLYVICQADPEFLLWSELNGLSPF
jgi:hypothetical protein